MPYYMLQVSYTPEAWAVQVGNPQNRLEMARPVVERLGGKVENGWFSFGDYDTVLICQFPDNMSSAALAMAAAAGGSVSSLKTTILMTMDEGIEALRKAGSAGYRPPSS